MIRDRGRIKWTSLMLPEHVKMLREWKKEDLREQPEQPDEQQLELFNEWVSEAKALQKKVIIEYNRYEKHGTVEGYIRSFDPFYRRFSLVNEEGKRYSVPVDQITDIRMKEE